MLLFSDEVLIRNIEVPFQVKDERPDTHELIKRMTSDFSQMPVASDLDEDGFGAAYARDALVMAALSQSVLPDVTKLTVRRLAELQGLIDLSNGTFADREEPGRIPHEIRSKHDPTAVEYTRQYGWQWPHFGSVDSTPLFVSAVARIATADPDFLSQPVTVHDGSQRTIAQATQAALAWIEKRLHESPTGLLESKMASNDCWLAWQDSPGAYHHSDGRLAMGQVAAVEVQAFVYDALIDASQLMRRGLISGDPNVVWAHAQKLRRTVIENFWVVDPRTGPFFALGAERNGAAIQPLAIRSANMGLLLESKLLEGGSNERYVTAIVAQLFDSSGLWSINGIRTLAADEKRYRPYGRHNGAVWPWQNLWIARGLRRHGYEDLAAKVEKNVRRVSDGLNCYPEFFQGGNDPITHVNESLIEVRGPDGRGGEFEYAAMEPAKPYQGWTIFGLHELLSRSESVSR